MGSHEEGDVPIVDTDPRPYLLEEGIYPARLEEMQHASSPWGEKLKARWTLFTCPSLTQSIELYRYYNASRKDGRIRCGPNHDFYRDWVALNNGILPRRADQFPLSAFKGKLFFVEVVTVKDNSRRRELNPTTLYSKVGRVIRPLGDDEQLRGLPLQLDDVGWKKP